jgi:hypothetical protein
MISCQTQKEKQDRTARKETGIRSAREALFYSTKALALMIW